MASICRSNPRGGGEVPRVVSLPIFTLLHLGIGFVLLAQVLSRQGVNHWGLDVLWLAPVALAGIVMGLRGVNTKRGQIDLASGILLLTWLITLDHWNLLVEHSRWCRRGMPPFGQISTVGR